MATKKKPVTKVVKKSSYSTSEILKRTNQLRTANGLAPLKENKSLSRAAEARAKDMVLTGSFSHKVATTTPNVTPWTFLKDAGYGYKRAGENLARGYKNATDTVKGWEQSPTHKKNILNPDFVETGIAIMKGKDKKNYVIQFFGNTK